MVPCCDSRSSFSPMYSRLPSDEQTVKAWFRDYSIGLAAVGIKLGLSPTQQSELEHRLFAVCQGSGDVAPTKARFQSGAVIDRLTDPIRSRWLAEHVLAQGET
jgi:hypothetical protein